MLVSVYLHNVLIPAVPVPFDAQGKIDASAQERNDPTLRAGLPSLRAWARPREGHGKGKLIRILFSVYFGEFHG